MPQIILTLSLAQTNLILEALGQLPYTHVYELVGTVQDQAGSQIGQSPERLEVAS
jgi:hypothetical protein